MGAYNVVLVWPDLVRPRPVIQISAGCELVHAAIPEDGACQSRPDGREERKSLEHLDE